MTGAPGGARLVVGFEGTEVSARLRDLLLETGARAVILFARNLLDASQARELCAALREAVPWPLLLCIDQEGGSVVRLTRGVTVFPGNMALGAADSPELARAQGRISGRELAGIGIDLNLAPVVDLQTNPSNPGIGIRSLGSDPNRAEVLARALIEGHLEFSVRSCCKHFPGKGEASVDAHLDLPVLDLPLEEFFDPHLRVFEKLVRGREDLAVMTTHIVVEGLDPGTPATFSPAVARDLLRGRLGFRGLLLADDLEMGAISGYHEVPEAAVRAAAAGHDLVPVCHDPDLQLRAARLLDRALRRGDLDPVEHRRSLERLRSFAEAARGSAGGSPEETSPAPTEGAALADGIAAAAVHAFRHPPPGHPLPGLGPLVILAAEPRALVGVEEGLESEGWPRALGEIFGRGRRGGCRVFCFPADLEVSAVPPLLEEARREAARPGTAVLLLTWDAGALEGQGFLLAEACRTLGSRLVVGHLRNPFDQALVPDGIAAFTPFGFRTCQLRALAAVLRGEAEAKGIMPAKLQ